MTIDRPTTHTEPDIQVFDDSTELSLAAARHVVARLAHAVEQRGRADWATTGGSAPIGIYQQLSLPPLRDEVPWAQVHLWWGDERYVPRDHKLSNAAPADQILISTPARSGQSGWGEAAHDALRGIDPGAPIPSQNVHVIPTGVAIGQGTGPRAAAEMYAAELRDSGVATRDGWPSFDLLLLGIGPDGHLLSVFPGSPALDEPNAWVLPVATPTHVEPHVERVTLNPRIVAAARDVLVVVQGEGKAEVMEQVFRSDRDPHRLPAQLARRAGATWLLDRAAGERLPGR